MKNLSGMSWYMRHFAVKNKTKNKMGTCWAEVEVLFPFSMYSSFWTVCFDTLSHQMSM